MSQEVDVDEVLRDTQDLSMLALETVGEVVIDVAGEPNSVGDLDGSVRVSGTLIVESIDDEGPR